MHAYTLYCVGHSILCGRACIQVDGGPAKYINSAESPIFSKGQTQTPHMMHCHTVHFPLGALLSPCTVCGPGQTLYGYHLAWKAAIKSGYMVLVEAQGHTVCTATPCTFP